MFGAVRNIQIQQLSIYKDGRLDLCKQVVGENKEISDVNNYIRTADYQF